MLNFCTLFNSAYLSRGLTMYSSLEKYCPKFHVYILAFDDSCFQALKDLGLKHATIISLKDFENEDLLRVKPERTLGEYCWTCTPSIIWYCLHSFSLNHCTYVDADLMFFDDPQVLFDEMEGDSVLITDHHYSSEYDQTEINGRYCVQFVTFINDSRGLKVLEWWKDACIEWCFNRAEDGKFGDQKYLDCWTERFNGVHELKHLGGGVAPWNVQQYTFKRKGKKIFGRELTTKKDFTLIFYHYHDFRYCEENVFALTAVLYRIEPDVVVKIYKPYVKRLLKEEARVKAYSATQVYHEPKLDLSWIRRSVGRQILFFLFGSYRNFYKIWKLKL